MPENSVLIVEDDEIITRVLLSMLRDGGFVLHTPVNSGEQVIEQVAAERPDIVLMDIDLPGAISGIEAATELFNIFTIPVIFVTGHDERKILEKAIGALPFGFLIKPVNPNLLYSAIKVSTHLCEKMRQTTEGKKAGLTPSMDVQISTSSHPILIINSGLKIIWMNQAAEECIGESSSSLFLKDVREGLSLRGSGLEISPDFFRSIDESRVQVPLCPSSEERQYIITSRPIMNMFGTYSGSFVTITTPSQQG
ncbi:response regulator [Methanospirillum sp. J.3.6.1-F.2.7.3]|uniref:Response regulator n=1 Tax=Methanospirillum purgamenti TaxID=2834276 RepID=A0A8E7B4P0_9EURY|nr:MULTISPECIES: response regulator [Methanospirillum]MDX8550187.1 response regulator [Methanospirillum hungatei]QVV90422.1 response regulator [Methanospirillum sp. J.3.6.1-F.2.7.3]